MNTPTTNKSFGTFLRSMNPLIDEQAKSAIYIYPQDFERPPIPTNFDGRIAWKDYLTPIYDQGNCAGCYAFSTVSILSDRYALQTILQVKPYFDPLELVMCYVETGNAQEYKKLFEDLNTLQEEEQIHIATACKGNTIYNAGVYLFRFGAVEDKCVPMKVLEQSLKKTGSIPTCTIIEGPKQDLCVDNNKGQKAWPASTIYTLEGKGDELITNIKLEIMKWGPLSVAFKVYPDFIRQYDGKSIYIPAPNQPVLGGHAVKLLGWGVEGNISYWICANSWGTDWGDNGYFKIVQGHADLELEINHLGLLPLIPGVEAAPHHKVNALVTEENIKEREYNAVDPVTFYPKRILDLVKAGKLSGNLDPIMDVSRVPLTADFYAYSVGHTSFMTFGGGFIDTYQRPSAGTRIWFRLSIICMSIILGLIFLLWRCHHKALSII